MTKKRQTHYDAKTTSMTNLTLLKTNLMKKTVLIVPRIKKHSKKTRQIIHQIKLNRRM